MEAEVIICLIDKYLDGTATADDLKELDRWYNSFNDQPNLYNCGSEETDRAVRAGFLELKAKISL